MREDGPEEFAHVHVRGYAPEHHAHILINGRRIWRIPRLQMELEHGVIGELVRAAGAMVTRFCIIRPDVERDDVIAPTRARRLGAVHRKRQNLCGHLWHTIAKLFAPSVVFLTYTRGALA